MIQRSIEQVTTLNTDNAREREVSNGRKPQLWPYSGTELVIIIITVIITIIIIIN